MLAKRALSLPAVILLTALPLAACSSGDKAESSRPSEKTIAAALQKGTMAVDEKSANCFAKVFVDSDISDETLKKAVKANGGATNSDEIPAADRKIVASKEFGSKLLKCAPSAPTPSAPSATPSS